MVKFFCVLSGGRLISVFGHNLDVVQEPRMVVTVSLESVSQNKKRKRRRRRRRSAEQTEDVDKTLGRPARMVVDPICSEDPQCSEVCVCLCAPLFMESTFLSLLIFFPRIQSIQGALRSEIFLPDPVSLPHGRLFCLGVKVHCGVSTGQSAF